MNFWWKLGAVFVVILLIFSGGMYTEYRFHLAKQVPELINQVEKAQRGQNEIIKVHQQLEKAYDQNKDSCLDAPVPDDIQRLLK